MEPRELERHLKRNELAPVIFLWGEESWLVDEAIRQIEAVVLAPESRAFDHEVFYGDEAEPQAIVSAAQTLPWLASQRVVLVREAEALPRAADPALVAYCKQPSPSTCLIFTAQRAEASREQLASIVDYSDEAIIGKTLEGVPGVPAKTARQIYAQLHKAGRA